MATRVWTIEEAQNNIDQLLDAALISPQIIRYGNDKDIYIVPVRWSIEVDIPWHFGTHEIEKLYQHTEDYRVAVQSYLKEGKVKVKHEESYQPHPWRKVYVYDLPTLTHLRLLLQAPATIRKEIYDVNFKPDDFKPTKTT